MKYQHPKLRSMLAAEYVLGTLRGRARKRFTQLLRAEAGMRGEVHYWENRLAGLNLNIPTVMPRERVWAEIEYRINQSKVTPIAVARSSMPPAARLLRTWAGFATAASVVLAFGLWQQMQKPPQVVTETRTVRVEVPQSLPYVAVLQPEKSKASWKVSVYPERGVIKVAAVGHYDVDADVHSLQLWVIEKNGPKPLGLLPLNGEGEMPMPKDVEVSGDMTLAVSLEPHGGSPTGLPTGPVLLAAPAIRAL